MKILQSYSVIVISFSIFFACSCGGKKNGTELNNQIVSFKENISENCIDILIDNKLFTTFQWTEYLTKPILYPILSSGGKEINRGYPIQLKDGERADHSHQVGMWLTYGNVNGSDFWGNGFRGLGTKNSNGGIIKHIRIEKIKEGKGEGILVTNESWIDSTGVELLKERTEFHFISKDSIRIIDRVTTLTAEEDDIFMPDTKEGMFGLRVARQLELPDKSEIVLYNAQGQPEKVNGMDNTLFSGNYRSSEGVTGLDVWGTRARWMNLFGEIDGERISIIICDHPENLNYPTWWHARGYGLFAANPLGGKDFTDNQQEVNFSISAGKSAIFKYRVIISSGFHLTDKQINMLVEEFGNTYGNQEG